MEKIDSLNQVAEFHRTFGAPVLENPQIPAQERCDLRISLLQEELSELKEAIAEGNITEVADALCDLQYVLSGAVLEFGLGGKFVDLFNEVHRSNMTKACSSISEAEETVAHYTEKGEACFFEQSGEKYNVHRTADHKVLKNKYYSAADLRAILEN